MINGSMVAIVTPMTKDYSVDKQSFCSLIEFHIDSGTNGIVVCGSTGESATLTTAETIHLIKLALKTANKRIPIIAGTGTNSTAATIEKTKQAKELGVDACLIVTPYYNRPTQEGLYLHYKAVAENVDIPIILYNVPNRTASDMLPETIARLSSIDNIVAVKEATGDLARLDYLRQHCNKSFRFFSGDDSTGLAFMEQGGHGVISVTANVAPALMSDMCKFALSTDKNNTSKAKYLDEKLKKLHGLFVVEPNPIPVKWALGYLGKIMPTIRLPLTNLTKQNQELLKAALNQANISKE